MPPSIMLTRVLLAVPLQAAAGFLGDSICQGLEMRHSQQTAVDNPVMTKTQIVNPDEDTDTDADALKSTDRPKQEHEEATKKGQVYSIRRSTTYALVGGCIMGPLAILRYHLFDLAMPGNRLFVEVPVKTTAELMLFAPITSALAMGLNEYFKPEGTKESTIERLRREYWKILLASYSSKALSMFFFSFDVPMTNKFIMGLLCSVLLSIFNSWRINVDLGTSKMLNADFKGKSIDSMGPTSREQSMDRLTDNVPTDVENDGDTKEEEADEARQENDAADSAVDQEGEHGSAPPVSDSDAP